MNLGKYRASLKAQVSVIHTLLHLPLGGCWHVVIHQVTDFSIYSQSFGKKRRKCQARKFEAIKENQSWLVLKPSGGWRVDEAGLDPQGGQGSGPSQPVEGGLSYLLEFSLSLSVFSF